MGVAIENIKTLLGRRAIADADRVEQKLLKEVTTPYGPYQPDTVAVAQLLRTRAMAEFHKCWDNPKLRPWAEMQIRQSMRKAGELSGTPVKNVDHYAASIFLQGFDAQGHKG